MTEEERQPIGRREWIGIGCVALLFLVLRLPLYRGDALLLGWNSDAGVFGLMARRIRDGAFPIFFWGQSYMGVLTSFIAAAIGFVSGNVGPLALRLAAAAEVLASIVLYWLGLRRAFDRGTALMVAAWLAAGPWYLFHFTVAPIGAEQAFFLGGVLFWFVTRAPLRTWRQWLVFGLLTGFTWWINQSAIFVGAAAIVVAILESEWWSHTKPVLRPMDRLLLRERPVIVRATGLLLAFLTLLGILRSAGLPVPALFLHSPVAEPLVLLLAFYALLFGRSWREVRPARSFFHALGAFAVGFTVAYLPVIIGGIHGAYPRTYGLSAPVIELDQVPRRIATIFRSDWWQLIGGDATVLGVTISIAMMALLALNLVERPATSPAGARRSTSIAAMTIILAGAFFLFSSRSHEGTVRYIVVALPLIYAYAARAGARSRPAAAVLLVVLVAMVAARRIDARAVAAGQREQYATLPGGFDPRPALAAIDRAGFTVCDADYWIAYKLQWISNERVRFIVSHGYTRNRVEVRQLVSQCHVDYLGRLTKLSGTAVSSPVPHKDKR
jgi:hypothetical protein